MKQIVFCCLFLLFGLSSYAQSSSDFMASIKNLNPAIVKMMEGNESTMSDASKQALMDLATLREGVNSAISAAAFYKKQNEWISTYLSPADAKALRDNMSSSITKKNS